MCEEKKQKQRTEKIDCFMPYKCEVFAGRGPWRPGTENETAMKTAQGVM